MSSDIQVTNALFTKIIKMNALDKLEIDSISVNNEKIENLEEKNKEINNNLLIYNDRLENIYHGKNAITIMTFEAEGKFDTEVPYTWSMGNGSCAASNFGFIYPFKGKIIAWAFNCMGSNQLVNKLRTKCITYSSIVFNLIIDGCDMGEIEFKSDVKYDIITKTGRSKGILTIDNDVDFSDINLEFNRYNGPPFDQDARYRVSFYIQSTESMN